MATIGRQESESSFPVDSLQTMEDSALQEQLQKTLKLNETLSKENAMFDKFLKRLDRKDVQVKAISTVPSPQMDLRIPQRKKMKSRSSYVTETTLRLTVEQKCNIATRELDELREDRQRKEEEFERSSDNHRAVIGEADFRLQELKKLQYEFERDIVRGAINPRTGYVIGEKVIRHFEDRLRSRDTLIEKLRLKNSTLRVKKKKLQAQLKQKEETGEVRHEVDFDQLKIENQQFNERCEEKNQELLKLKFSAGNTTQVLNSFKKKLHALSVESESLDEEMQQRRELQDKIEAETRIVTKEKESAEELNTEARRKLEDYKVPDVMEYVREKATLHELAKTVKAWERKVEIAEMALRTHRQTWRKLCQQSGQSLRLPARTFDPMQSALY